MLRLGLGLGLELMVNVGPVGVSVIGGEAFLLSCHLAAAYSGWPYVR